MRKKTIGLLMAICLLLTSFGTYNVKAEEEKSKMDFTLEEAIDYALENNRNIKLAQITLEESKFKYKVEGRKIDDSKNEQVIGLTAAVYKEMTKDRLKLAVTLNEQGLETAKETIKTSAKSLYYELNKMNELIKIQKESINLAKESLEMAENKFKVGTGIKNDILTAELSVSNLELELSNYEISLNSIMMNFNDLIGLPIETKINVTGEVKFEKFQDIEVNELVEKAYEDRADVYNQVEKYSLLLKEQNISNKYYPEQTSPYKQKQFEVDKAAINLENKKVAVKIEVINDYQKLNNIENNIKKYENDVEKVEQNLKIIKLRYDIGTVILQDVLNTQNMLNKAKLQKTTAIYDYMSLKNKLENYLE